MYVVQEGMAGSFLECTDASGNPTLVMRDDQFNADGTLKPMGISQ